MSKIKQCSKCKVELNETTKTKGTNSYCDNCGREYGRNYRKTWYSNPENKAKAVAYAKERREKLKLTKVQTPTE